VDNARQTPLIGDTKVVRLFRNGANQAVRIPREFELSSLDVTIRKVGNALVIEPVAQIHPRGSAAALLAALASLEAIDDVWPDVDEGMLSLDDVAL
jgi:antitoxin VapB